MSWSYTDCGHPPVFRWPLLPTPGEQKKQKFTLQRDLPASSHFTKCFQRKENTPIMQKTLISFVMARFMPLSDITSLDERIFPYLMETLKVQCNHQIEQSLKVSSVLFLCSVAKLCVGTNVLEVNFLHISREWKYCWHKYNRMCRLFICFLKVSLWGQQTNFVFVRENFYWKHRLHLIHSFAI